MATEKPQARAQTERLFWILSIVLLGLCGACSRRKAPKKTGIPSASWPERLVVATAESIAPWPSTDRSHFFYGRTVYETLLRSDDAGGFVPWLAENVTVSPDGTRVVVCLRKNLTFHDNSLLTTQTVFDSLESALPPSAARPIGWPISPVLAPLKQWKAQASGEKADALGLSSLQEVHLTNDCIEFVLPSANRYFLQALATIPIVSLKDPNLPSGSGPYLLHNLTPDHVQLVRNPRYWGRMPVVRTFDIWRLELDSANWNRLADREFNLWFDVPSAIVPTQTSAPKIHNSFALLKTRPYAASVGRVRQNGPFRDPRLRKALALLIDYETLSNQTPGSSPMPMPVGPELPVEGNGKRTFYDPVNAASYLEQAGWRDPNGDGKREWLGPTRPPDKLTPLSLTVLVGNQRPEHTAFLQAAEKAGITVAIRKLDVMRDLTTQHNAGDVVFWDWPLIARSDISQITEELAKSVDPSVADTLLALRSTASGAQTKSLVDALVLAWQNQWPFWGFLAYHRMVLLERPLQEMSQLTEINGLFDLLQPPVRPYTGSLSRPAPAK